MSAYYNEFDAKKAAWLRELIKQGLIADGDVDERSIADVRPADVRGYTQCHWFAGVGVWSYALRLAGWEDSRPVWTGSCPCPSFSVAGKGEGFSDPRHLWPDWYRLIRESRPPAVFGEQSDAAIGYGWLDLVQTDVETENYAIGKAVLGACSVGAPHRRQRLYFVADALAQSAGARYDDSRQHGGGSSPLSARLEQCGGTGDLADAAGKGLSERSTAAGSTDRVERPERLRGVGELALSPGERLEGSAGGQLRRAGRREERGTTEPRGGASRGMAYTDGGQSCDGSLQRSGEYGLQSQDSGAGGVADALLSERRPIDGPEQDGRYRRDGGRAETRGESGAFGEVRNVADAPSGRYGEFGNALEQGNGRHADGHGLIDCLDSRGRPGPVNGFWRDADWIFCTDGKWRAVRPGSQPLATGTPARVGRLRGYGDAICAQVAAAFISAYMETADGR